MMRCNTFVRSALFAAVATAGWLPWALVAGPIVGGGNARALYLVGSMALYIAGLSPQSTRRITVAMVAGLAGCGLALVARTTAELSIGLAAVLGIARSAFLYRTAPTRAVATEVSLLVGGLLFARFLGGSSPPSTGLAIWGFLLVQSLFFLVAGRRTQSVPERHADPFEEAHRRVQALLERTGI